MQTRRWSCEGKEKMNQFPLPSLVFVLISLTIILFLLCGILAWTYRISLRINKLDGFKFGIRFGVAFVQILLGIVITAVLMALKLEPNIGIAIGIGTAILFGMPALKLFIRLAWKPTLRVWGVAAVMQLVLIPIYLLIVAVVFVQLLLWVYPPVY
jgi:hypothetical protein